MDEVVKAFSSPVFLVGTVLCGLLINIASNYLQRHLDKGQAFLKRWRGVRSAARQTAIDKHLNELMHQPELVELYIARENRLWSATLVFFFMTMVLAALYFMGSQAGGGVPMMLVRTVVLGVGLGTLTGGIVLMNSATQAAEVLIALGRARRANDRGQD